MARSLADLEVTSLAALTYPAATAATASAAAAVLLVMLSLYA